MMIKADMKNNEIFSKAVSKYTKMCPFCHERSKESIQVGSGMINLHQILNESFTQIAK